MPSNFYPSSNLMNSQRKLSFIFKPPLQKNFKKKTSSTRSFNNIDTHQKSFTQQFGLNTIHFILNLKFKYEHMAEQSPISIAFDEENNIRVLQADKYRESDQLKGLSMEFITKVISMDQNMNALTECLDEFAIKIEKEKLRALGERNKWESEAENRKKKMMDLNNLLNEKKSELDRHTAELQSLNKFEQEQKALINKLSHTQE